eukprot:12850824-Ditylum_brightwellii.AAC.1
MEDISIERSKMDEGDLEGIELIRPNTLVPDMVIKRNLRKKRLKTGRKHGVSVSLGYMEQDTHDNQRKENQLPCSH